MQGGIIKFSRGKAGEYLFITGRIMVNIKEKSKPFDLDFSGAGNGT